MSDLAKLLIIFGAILMGVGVILGLLGKFSMMGKLPGDIYIRREHFVFYFPITTSVLVSLVLTVLFSLFRKR
ncbi:MAG: DUF2905 domain-containing protein [Candidatus Omnitrophica bacterium]|nr:DUF2905 domain-containing protein [Candidatus Omnitrophota bacterium]